VVVCPNPNNGIFVVKSTSQNAGNSSYFLINALGQTLRTIVLDTADNREVTISGLPAGVYTLVEREGGARYKVAVTW